MNAGDKNPTPSPGEQIQPYSPVLRQVIENPSGAFQKWKRGEISYLQMCGDFTQEITLARLEADAVQEPEQAREELTRTIG